MGADKDPCLGVDVSVHIFISFIIHTMNEFMINLLKKVQKYLEESSVDTSVTTSQTWRRGDEKKSSLATRFFWILIIVGWYILMGVMLFSLYYAGSFWNNIFWYYEHFISFSFLCIQTLLFVYMAWKIYKNENRIMRLFYIIYIPLFFASFSIFGYLVDIHARYMSEFHLMLSGLLMVYPLLHILGSFSRKLEIPLIQHLKNFFLFYNLGFFFLLSLNIIVISLGFNIDIVQPYTTVIIEILRDQPYWLLSGIFFLCITFFVLTYGVFALNISFTETGKSRKSLRMWLIAISIVFILSFIPSILDYFYISQINKASQILSHKWQNIDGYTDARVFLLDRAFYSRIKNRKNVDLDLFKKIYDTTPEEYFGEKIAKYTDSRSSFGTNSSKVGDAANVTLRLAEIENRINTGSVFQILETTYRFNFINSSNTNQEVILNFEAPTKDSVVSNLRLWLDLELIGQIAPRWAAKKVYEDSLRRNTDPALIEKVGLSTYTLRVFPIPAKQDIKTQGRQLVEVKILTPILHDKEKITYAPKFSFINLKFDDASGIISKIYKQSELIKEDIVKKEDIEKYLKSEHALEFNTTGNYTLWEFCIDPDIMNQLPVSTRMSSLETPESGKISVFFDNSLSVERNGSNNYYGEIYTKLKGFWNTLHDVDMYSYNFDVNKILSPSDIKFFGYSDMDRIIDFIINNKIMNQKIVFVTDDDNFNYSTVEDVTRNYSSLVTNQISVIKIGNKVKTYKQEINNILSATNGNIYEVDKKSDIGTVISKIFDTKKWDTSFSTLCSSPLNDDSSKKIQAGYIWNILLSLIWSEYDWQNIAQIQTIIAQKYGIINQFNSFIALENNQQQQDLNRYSNASDAYSSSYSNNEWSITSRPSGWMMFQESRIMDSVSVSSDFESSRSNGILGKSYNSNSLRWAIDPDYYSSYDEPYHWKIELNLSWILMFLIYLVEFYGFITFLVDYRKGNP